ncbi:hypothetical protein COBT_001780 [Conglomerata obtusa]
MSIKYAKLLFVLFTAFCSEIKGTLSKILKDSQYVKNSKQASFTSNNVSDVPDESADSEKSENCSITFEQLFSDIVDIEAANSDNFDDNLEASFTKVYENNNGIEQSPDINSEKDMQPNIITGKANDNVGEMKNNQTIPDKQLEIAENEEIVLFTKPKNIKDGASHRQNVKFEEIQEKSAIKKDSGLPKVEGDKNNPEKILNAVPNSVGNNVNFEKKSENQEIPIEMLVEIPQVNESNDKHSELSPNEDKNIENNTNSNGEDNENAQNKNFCFSFFRRIWSFMRNLFY